MEYTGCDGEKYVKFDPKQWLAIYCLKESEQVKVLVWPDGVDRGNLENHYRDRPDADLICLERVGLLVAAQEFLRKGKALNNG